MTASQFPSTVRRAVGHDALLLAWRNYKHHVRVPSLVVFPLMTPMIFLLLFRYVLGGS